MHGTVAHGVDLRKEGGEFRLCGLDARDGGGRGGMLGGGAGGYFRVEGGLGRDEGGMDRGNGGEGGGVREDGVEVVDWVVGCWCRLS